MVSSEYLIHGNQCIHDPLGTEMDRMSLDPATVVSSWLLTFSRALQTRDARAAADCFLFDGWLRESQIFCWNKRTLHGRDQIYQHIAEHLPRRSFSNFRADSRMFLSPERARITPQHEGIKAGFFFETAVQWGQAYVQLSQDGNEDWRALTVYMTATDIKGHEESGREVGIYGGHTIPWPIVLATRRKEAEESPHVLISELIDYLIS